MAAQSGTTTECLLCKGETYEKAILDVCKGVRSTYVYASSSPKSHGWDVLGVGLVRPADSSATTYFFVFVTAAVAGQFGHFWVLDI